MEQFFQYFLLTLWLVNGQVLPQPVIELCMSLIKQTMWYRDQAGFATAFIILIV